MFCPKCATQNIDGASFCRSCGANIALVPQAMDKNLPAAPAADCTDFGLGRRRRRSEPSIESGVRSLMMGIAFAVISILIGKYMPGGFTWWYWMLIPAATFLGKGISDLLRLKYEQKQPPAYGAPQLNTLRPTELPTPRTGELRSPVGSVTEGTTRHLGAEAQTRHLDSH